MISGKDRPLRTKKEIREDIWTIMTNKKVGVFPLPLFGRIPNFQGARVAAAKLFSLPIWKKAHCIKVNPDSPQRWLRQRALEEGKTVYMAVPRLRAVKCFLRVQIPPKLAKKAASIKGAFQLGKPMHPGEMKPVDLVIMGSVAVNPQGERIGKGGGYGDLELALAHEFQLLTADTPIVTTVHDLQVLSEHFPQKSHDSLLDYILTPSQLIKCENNAQRKLKLHWDRLSPEQLKEIPILQELQTA
ncbi:MAG: 5-formyltetrahydrofolate cyclo-ligase [Candidatus Hodarchaeota archaeon]